jgi:tRNA-splicing ligase RtcB
MRVPGVVFASPELLPPPGDEALAQVANVATLPGIVDASYAMPDVHWGYGFPIGGVAATDVDDGGVVSPGGVGFDISCGVRLLVTDVDARRAGAALPAIADALDAAIPRGMGGGAVWRLRGRGELEALLREGSRAAVAAGFGTDRDLEHCEDFGAVDGAAPQALSERAYERGLGQVGSLGSGNHFLEVQEVDAVFDRDTAAAFGLAEGILAVMIHWGSRGLGHQVCTDYVHRMLAAMPRYGIAVPDRQLACAPVDSPEGRDYLAAMAAAANYGRANRHVLAHTVREIVQRLVPGSRVELLYDVSHNLAKLETFAVAGRSRRLLVHRKGATRAFPPGHPDLPDDLRPHGQPVLVPGSMGTASYVLGGGATSGGSGAAFFSACHGAGRRLSRHAAAKGTSGRAVRDELSRQGVLVRPGTWRGLAEEAPAAYKDVDDVVEVCERAGLARRVARLRPRLVVKG